MAYAFSPIASDIDDGGPTALRPLETRIGAFAAAWGALIACIANTGALVAARDGVFAALALLCIAMQGVYVVLVWASISSHNPRFGVGVVRRQPRLEGPAQIFVALGWFLQFVTGCIYTLI